MMVTLKDVAREAEVSTHTVSAVLNGNADRYRISPQTCDRIREVAAQLGYDRDSNRGARQMVARKHGMRIPNDVIAISSVSAPPLNEDLGRHTYLDSLHNHPYESQVMYGIEAAAHRRGLDVLVCRHYGGRMPRLLKKGEVDGIISLATTPETLSQLEALDMPVVTLVSPCENFHNIAVANHEGTYMAVQHLIELGHHNIAYIGHRIGYDVVESSMLNASRERFAGYQQAMNAANLPTNYVDINRYRQTQDSAAEAIASLWQQSGGTITAVVCYNDTFAMGVIRYLESLGLRVPQDVSVTGFDDVSAQFGFKPVVSSTRYDRFELGQRAVEALWRLREPWLADERMEWINEVLPVEFVQHETTAPPRREQVVLSGGGISNQSL